MSHASSACNAPARRRTAARLTLTAIGIVASGAALAVTPWSPPRVLQPTFGVSSPPEAPLVAMNALGRAVFAWNATGIVRTADRLPSGAWTASRGVPGGSTGAGPVAVAVGRGDLTAIAFSTVATRYVPSKLLVSLRPAGGVFGPAVEIAPGTAAGTIKLGIDCAGSVTALWSNASGLSSSTLPGTPPPAGSCSGAPGSGAWTPAALVSNAHVGAGLPELTVNDAGAALAVWQEGAPGNPSSIVAAYRAAGGAWQAPATVSAPTARPTWNPKPGLDAAGNAVVGYLDGSAMAVARRAAAGVWQSPETISGTQQVQYPALAVSEAGDVLAAWLAFDPAGGTSVWQRVWQAGAWTSAGRLSGANDTPDWPNAAISGDGSLAVVSWTDNSSLVARASTWQAGAWTRQNLGGAYWGGQVSVAAGGGKASAGFARVVGGNPNSAQLVGRGTQ